MNEAQEKLITTALDLKLSNDKAAQTRWSERMRAIGEARNGVDALQELHADFESRIEIMKGNLLDERVYKQLKKLRLKLKQEIERRGGKTGVLEIKRKRRAAPRELSVAV